MPKPKRQYVDVPLNGVDTSTDSKRVELGKMQNIENMYQEHTGELTKRYGGTRSSETIVGGNTLNDLLDTNTSVFEHNGTLYLNNQDKLYSYLEDEDVWIDNGFCSNIPCSSNVISGRVSIDDAINKIDCCTAYDGTTQYALHVYTSPVQSLKYAVIVNVDSGHIIVSQLSVANFVNCFTLTGLDPSRMYIVGFNIGHGARYQYYDIDNAEFTTLTTLSNLQLTTTMTKVFSVIARDSITFCIAYTDGTDTYIERVHNNGTSMGYFEMTGFVPDVLDLVTDGTLVYILYFESGQGTNVVIVDSNMDEEVANQVISATTTPVTHCFSGAKSTYLSGGGIRFFYTQASTAPWTGAPTAPFTRVITGTITQAGTISTLALAVDQVYLLSTPVEVLLDDSTSKFLFFVAYTDTTDLTAADETVQSAVFLVDDSGKIYKRFLVDSHILQVSSEIDNLFNLNELDNGNLYTNLVQAIGGTTFEDAGILHGVTLGLSTSDDATNTQRLNQKSVKIRENLLLCGGAGGQLLDQGQVFRTTALTPNGFNLYPSRIRAANGGAGSCTIGTHNCVAIYKWLDSKGNLYRSTPSVPDSITIGSSIAIDIDVPTLLLTNKDYEVYITVYMTTDGGTLYYRVGDIANGPTVKFVTVTATLSDADLVAEELLYTTGGVLDNITPPSIYDVTVLGDKVLVVPELDRNKIWESKPLLNTIGMEFSDSLVNLVDFGGDITAIQVMDGVCYVFKEESIFYFYGEGANALGLGSFSTPQILHNSIGALNNKCVILTDFGIVFASKHGLYLLTKSRTLEHIGDPIENHTDFDINNLRTILIKQSNKHIYFVAENATTTFYVWDYKHNAWYIWDYPATIDSSEVCCMFDDAIVQAGRSTSFSGVVIEDTSFTDGSSFNEITAKVRTPWIKTGGIVGHQKVNSILILGEYKSAHDPVIKVYEDYNETTPVQTLTITTPPTGPYLIHFEPEDAECTAIQIELYDTEHSGTDESFTITGIVFEIMPMDGVQKKLKHPNTKERGMGFFGTIGSGINKGIDWLSGKRGSDDATVEKFEGQQQQMGDHWRNAYQAQGNAMQGRAGPQMQGAQMQLGNQNQTRMQQQGLISALQARASGQAPSAAEMSFRQGREGQMADLMSARASQRGMSPGAANRQMMQQMAHNQQQSRQDLGMLRAQEQAGAEAMLGNALSGMRGQDIGVASQQAGFNQGANQANLQAALQQRQMNDQMASMYEQQGFSRDQAQLMADQQAEQNRFNAWQAEQGIHSQQAMADRAARGQTTSALIGAGASLMTGK